MDKEDDQQVMDVSDDDANELNASHSSSQLNQSMKSVAEDNDDDNENMNNSIEDNDGDDDDDNDDDEDMDNMNSSLNDSLVSNTSVGSDNQEKSSGGNSLTNSAVKRAKKRKKMTPLEKKRWLEKRESEKQERLKAKLLEKEKRAQERRDLLEKQRQEKQQKLDLEKEKKDKERQEKDAERQRIKEEKEAEKQRIKEQQELEKQKIKEEKEVEKQQKLKEKEDKLKEKEEKIKEKELEKQKKQEEKQKASEEELKKTEKQRQLLSNFFSKTPKSANTSLNKEEIEVIYCGRFLPFHLGANQTLAPVVSEFAKNRFNQQALDQWMKSQETNNLYFNNLKSDTYKPFRCNRREKIEPEIIIESSVNNNSDGNDDDNESKRYRVKHLQFHSNVRPPYRGTYSKKSSVIKPRNPFTKDIDLFDYELESDEEWDEGGPGESLNGSDSEGSVKDDYEIDNEFFVPHGYLSEDENDENEEQVNGGVIGGVGGGEDVEMSDTKDSKSRPLLKEQVLMAERNRSFSRTLNPVVIGCIWESNADNNNQKSVDILYACRRIALQTK
ncbi:chromatin assembly factor 1 subunit A-like [Oppia nitens]|uniref:chromatin assembly factor 1 subunit A-like n=1 Tax=Oppia nitens TaxID=1686743 RepID=UPI0023DAD307|nr:chromatin assembly factor 1 subunit A-like [Oppia nitens]